MEEVVQLPNAKQEEFILKEEAIGNEEFLLVHIPNAPMPYVSRHGFIFAEDKGYWRHAFVDYEKALADFTTRTEGASEELANLRAGQTPSKRYPFSVKEHAHDIEFACNRTHNQMTEALNAGKYNEAARLEEKYDKLSDLLSSVLGTTDTRQIAWLTGSEIALAKETVAWACQVRGSNRPSLSKQSGHSR